MKWLLLIPCLLSQLAMGAEVTLAWDASTSTNVSSYVIRYGLGSVNYTASISVPSTQTNVTITGLPLGTLYFAAFARTAQNVESDPSNEISWANLFWGANLRIVRTVGSPTTLEGSADLQSWQTVGVFTPGSVPPILPTRARQVLRASTPAPMPVVGFTAASAPPKTPILKPHKQRGVR